MAGHSPLDDPETAAFAWSRYKRLMRIMALVSLSVAVLSVGGLYYWGGPESVHFYIAVALGIGITMMLTSALMGLVFLSSGTGHDDSFDD
ncbi:MAG: hypothetical protein K5799_07190 [Erythrobacter sp.]|nr:hypothetical protein [Erythrobacter sp.]